MTEVPTLTTERFTMRPAQAGDEHALFPAYSDPGHMRYWSRAPFADVESFREYLFDPNSGGRTWIPVPHGGGDPVMTVYAGARLEGVFEIGYMILPNMQRQGIARECVSALVTHLFRSEGAHRLFADIDPRNTASNRLVRSLGFTREAHLRDAMKTHIGWCDTWLWGLLEDEWPH
ncbi:GNAT family N-acetyltransferase [Alteraurantiacibacter aquimixticola]|uniref:N-acetyltransferase n=1 Tax=Alteraurantiacibacter aquimixticola TaxID=2489173 RepID=A0A4T3F6G8_9SPHN|nr:GNAT family protein [Alteraurantiacibacter aquimixticola]TIX50456.1 N-acetyltransferase [Alteraurantiacibacter aquimixticola]